MGNFTYIVISLTDMVDSSMYAVINNSMGSGSVTYECEGHETRLSDCMSPLSSSRAPCYYALVKCFSTTDKKSGGSTTSGLSADIVAGVVVSLLVVVLVVTIVVIIIVWLKRRDKNLKPGNNNENSTSPQTLPKTDIETTCSQDDFSYQPTTAFLSGTEAGNVTQLQENPYQPITVVSARTNTIILQDNPSYQPISKTVQTDCVVNTYIDSPA